MTPALSEIISANTSKKLPTGFPSSDALELAGWALYNVREMTDHPSLEVLWN